MSSEKRPKPDDYHERDLAILRMTYRLDICLAESVSRCFLGGKPAQHVIRRLSDRGLLDLHSRAIDSKYSYATLTKRGLKELGIENGKEGKLSPTALDTALSVSWYCTLSETRRYALTHAEVTERYKGEAQNNAKHILTLEFGEPVVHLVKRAPLKTATSKDQVKRFFSGSRQKSALAPAISSGDYGLLLLCPTKERKAELVRAFEKAKLFSLGTLVVAIGPDHTTFGPLLRKRG